MQVAADGTSWIVVPHAARQVVELALHESPIAPPHLPSLPQ